MISTVETLECVDTHIRKFCLNLLDLLDLVDVARRNVT